MILAIVGSHKHIDAKAKRIARGIILTYFKQLRPTKVISGGAEGIDQFAIELAKSRGIATQEYRPRGFTWFFFKERNKLIAENCDVMLVIRHKNSKTFGSGWTGKYAQDLGKFVYFFTIQ